MRSLIKYAYCGLYKYSGLLAFHEQLSRWRHGPPMNVLLFHRVSDDLPEDGLTVSTARFEAICQLLKRRFKVVSLSDVFQLSRSGRWNEPGMVAITFDDGYRDNFSAAQTLARYGLPACFFITTSFIGTDRIFDWDRGQKRIPNLTWDEVGEMKRMGFEIGSHTDTHADLGAVPVEQVNQELCRSKRIIEAQLGSQVRWFAYPFGGRHNFTAEGLQAAKEAGYEGCVSGYGGVMYPHVPVDVLPRQSVSPIGPLFLETRLRGGLDWLYALKDSRSRSS